VSAAVRRIGAPPPARLPLAGSLLLHAAAALLLWWRGAAPLPEHPARIRLVRLAGGGQNRPGWVAETPPAPPATEETRPAAEPARETERTAPVVARSPEPRARREPAREPESSPPPRRAAGEALDPAARRGRDAGAGPRGPGGSRTGATADEPDLAGMSQYLLRVEHGVQRFFNFPARSSGRKAVFHFLVERDGRVSGLKMEQGSGLPGLDLAGRSAILRAVLPPLPPAFPYDQIGVTFTFVDE